MNGSSKTTKRYWLNLTLATVAGQVGCLTIVLIVVALIAGLWLDQRLGTRPLFTLLLLLASIPVDVVLMFAVVRKATAKIEPSAPRNPAQEE